MNIRVIILSGIMTALIGAMIGLAVSRISQRIHRHKPIIITGAAIGFAIGSFQAAIREQTESRDEEYK